MKSIKHPAIAVALLASAVCSAMPEPVAFWKADGQAQPEPGTEAKTTKTIDVDYRQGISGKAFSFNGKTSVVETAFEWKSESTTTTWSVWIKPDESDRQPHILSADPFQRALYIRNGKIALYLAGGQNVEFGKVKWNAWQHVAVIFAPDHVTVYDRAGPTRLAFPDKGRIYQKKLLIGGSPLSGGSSFGGLIDHLAIYDRELTPSEIAELAIRPKNTNRQTVGKREDVATGTPSAKELKMWTSTEGKSLTAEFVKMDADSIIVRKNDKELRIPFGRLTEESVRQAKELAEAEKQPDAPTPIPAAPTTIQIRVASKVVKVDRWGAGNKALVFFSHTGQMNESVIAHINSYKPIFSAGYSIFLWNYPNSQPFSETQKTLQTWMRGEDAKLDLAGMATEAVDGIHAQTGIKEFLLVGDSLGAGILLADYARLSASGKVRFVMISPTEPFSPTEANLPLVKNSLLLANSKGDDYVRSSGFGKWIENQRTGEEITGKIPPGHLILGENFAHKLLADIIAGFLKEPLDAASKANSTPR